MNLEYTGVSVKAVSPNFRVAERTWYQSLISMNSVVFKLVEIVISGSFPPEGRAQ